MPSRHRRLVQLKLGRSHDNTTVDPGGRPICRCVAPFPSIPCEGLTTRRPAPNANPAGRPEAKSGCVGLCPAKIQPAGDPGPRRNACKVSRPIWQQRCRLRAPQRRCQDPGDGRYGLDAHSALAPVRISAPRQVAQVSGWRLDQFRRFFNGLSAAGRISGTGIGRHVVKDVGPPPGRANPFRPGRHTPVPAGNALQ